MGESVTLTAVFTPDENGWTMAQLAEWPAVVARMERNMAWMNRVVGNQTDPREPQLRIEEILEFLQKYARRS